MLKRNFFLSFVTIIVSILLVFTSCENGVEFDPAEYAGSKSENNGGPASPVVFTAEVANKGTGYGFTGSDSNYEIGYIDLTEASSAEDKIVSIELILGDLHPTLPITVEYIPVEQKANAISFIGKPTFNDLDFTAVGITSDNPIIIVDIPLAASPTLDQEGILVLKFSDDSGHAYDIANSPKEIKITIKRNKYEEIEFGDPLKFTPKVTMVGTDYTFDGTKIVYTDLYADSAKEAKTVSIKLKLENLHDIFPINVQDTKEDEGNFISITKITGGPNLQRAADEMQIDILLAANPENDQSGTVILKFSDASGGLIYDMNTSPTEIRIPIERKKYAEPLANSVIVYPTVEKIEGETSDYSFSGSDLKYNIEYTDTLDASTKTKIVSVKLTLAGLHPDASIAVSNVRSADFIGELIFKNGDPNAVSKVNPTLHIDIPLAHSVLDQTGKITLNLTPSNEAIYNSDSLKPIVITVNRYKYIAPSDVTLKFETLLTGSRVDLAQINDSFPTVSITDNGEGFRGIDFSLIEFPAIGTIPTGAGSQDIEVTIGDYNPTKGTNADFLDIHFCLLDVLGNCECNISENKIATFKPPGEDAVNNNRKLRVGYKPTFARQEGTVTINFEYDKNVYEDAPTKLTLKIVSNGNKKSIDVGSMLTLQEGEKDDAVKISGNDGSYNLTIKDIDKASTGKTNYEIPLQMDFIGELENYPVTITANNSTNLTVVENSRENKKVKFTATHAGVQQLEQTEGSVTLTIDSVHKEVYENLPFDIVITTKRDESFKYYIADHVKKFKVSTVLTTPKGLIDDGKYYTAVEIPGMSDSGGSKLKYVISRIDDSGTKVIYNEEVSASEKIDRKDKDAFILRNPVQEYTITVTHVGCNNSPACTASTDKPGSRLLTNRETLIASIETIRRTINWNQEEGNSKRYYRMDGHASASRLVVEERPGDVGNFYYGIERCHFVSDVYRKYFRFNNYINSFVTLNGTFMKDNAWGEYDVAKISGTWAQQGVTPCSQLFCKKIAKWTIDKDNGADKLNPRTDKLTVSYSGVTTTIELNKMVMEELWDGNNPGWSSGSFKVTQNGVMKEFNKDSGIPFGFFMEANIFKNKLLDANGNYTQK